jgi:hypothetical protein
MNDRGSDAEMKQRGHAHAVDKEAGVARRRATHEKIGQAADERDDTGQRLDGSKGVTERAGHLTDFGSRHLLATGLSAGAADSNFFDPGACLGRGMDGRRRRWGGCGSRKMWRRGDEVDARVHGLAGGRGRGKAPGTCSVAGGDREGCLAGDNSDVRDCAIAIDQ